MKKQLKRFLPFIVLFSFITLLFLITFAVKGIFPFGQNNIGYIDFNAGLVSSYTWLWDLLHGNANIFTSWDLGAGASMVTSAVLNGFLSPISWLIALFRRADVQFAISLIIYIKVLLISLVSYLTFKKLFFNVNKVFLVLYALLYTFSGWFFIHFTNIGWLEIYLLLPLLLYCAKLVIDKHQIFWFVITLTAMLCISYYLSYMVLVCAVICSLVYIVMAAKEKKKTASLLFYGVIISLLLSAFAFYPSMLISLKAYRFSSAVETGLFTNFFSKLSILLMYPILFVFFVKLVSTYRADRKNVLTFLLSFSICALGVIIEPINQMWHTGSYYCFPFRYSFLLVLILIVSNLYYLHKHPVLPVDTTKQEIKPVEEIKIKKLEQVADGFYYAIFSIIFLTASIINLLLFTFEHPYRAVVFTIILYFLIFASGFAIIYKVIQTKNHHFFQVATIVLLCVVQIFAYSIKFFGNDNVASTYEITNIAQIETQNLQDGYKIKDKENSYIPNFPLLLQYPSLSSWIHISDARQTLAYQTLGFNTESTVLFSSGGTLLSDFMVGNKYVLSRLNLDSAVYQLLDTFEYNDGEEMYLYQYNFYVPKILFVNENPDDVLLSENSFIQNQNALYQLIFNQTNDIASEQWFTEEVLDNGLVKYSLSVVGKKDIYICLENADIEYYQIGEQEITSIDHFVDLGIYENETLEFYIQWNEYEPNLGAVVFDVEQFITNANAYGSSAPDAEISYSANTIEIDINNTVNYAYAFIGFSNLLDITATNNGLQTQAVACVNNFMLVALEENQNEIILTYEPRYIKICILITLIAILVFALFSILSHRHAIAQNKFVIWFGFIGAILICAVIVVLVYAKPLISFFVQLIQ